MRRLLGVLGGMGPLATADFFRKIVEETPASCDQEHIPLIVDSVPSIPSRVEAILGGGESPLPQLLAAVRRLQQVQAEAIAIPCNTAHFWYPQLAQACRLPVLHIVDAVEAELASWRKDGRLPACVGLLATEATLATRIYEDRLEHTGIRFLCNSPEERARLVVPAITLVKQGCPVPAGQLLARAVQLLHERGAEASVLACTELPIALQAAASPQLEGCVDSTRALARAAVRWSLGKGAASPRSCAHELFRSATSCRCPKNIDRSL